MARLPTMGPAASNTPRLPSLGPQGNSANPGSVHPLLPPGPPDSSGWGCPPDFTSHLLLEEQVPPSLGKPHVVGGVLPITAPTTLTSEVDRQLQPSPSGPTPPATPTRQAQRKFPISPSPHTCPATAFPPQPKASLVSQLLKPKSLTSFLVSHSTGNPLILTSKATNPPPWTSSITPVRVSTASSKTRSLPYLSQGHQPFWLKPA